jgi:hypothetical protein
MSFSKIFPPFTIDRFQSYVVNNSSKNRAEIRIGRIGQAEEKTIAAINCYGFFTKFFLVYLKKSHRELIIKTSDRREIRYLVSIDSVVKRRFDYQLMREESQLERYEEEKPIERQVNAERIRKMTDEEFIDMILSDEATYHKNKTEVLPAMMKYIGLLSLPQQISTAELNSGDFIEDFNQIGITGDEFQVCYKAMKQINWDDRQEWINKLEFWKNMEEEDVDSRGSINLVNQCLADLLIDYIILKTISPSRFTRSFAEYNQKPKALGKAIRDTKAALMKPEAWVTLSSRERAYVEREKALQKKNLLKTTFLSKCLQALE